MLSGCQLVGHTQLGGEGVGTILCRLSPALPIRLAYSEGVRSRPPSVITSLLSSSYLPWK